MWVAGPSYFAVEHLTACLIYWWRPFVYTQFVATSDEEMEAGTLYSESLNCFVIILIQSKQSDLQTWRSPLYRFRYWISYRKLLYLFFLHLRLLIIILLMQHNFFPLFLFCYSPVRGKFGLWGRCIRCVICLYSTPHQILKHLIDFREKMLRTSRHWRRSPNWPTFLFPKISKHNTWACEILTQERYDWTCTLRVIYLPNICRSTQKLLLNQFLRSSIIIFYYPNMIMSPEMSLSFRFAISTLHSVISPTCILLYLTH